MGILEYNTDTKYNQLGTKYERMPEKKPSFFHAGLLIVLMAGACFLYTQRGINENRRLLHSLEEHLGKNQEYSFRVTNYVIETNQTKRISSR